MSELPLEIRAGGIVFKKNEGLIQLLLVTSNSNRTRWVIPAGHVEPGETHQKAAVREVLEEAGVNASPVAYLGNFQYTWFRSANLKVRLQTHLFLMKYIETIETNPENRLVGFFSLEEIHNLNLWEESQAFILKAHEAALSI